MRYAAILTLLLLAGCATYAQMRIVTDPPDGTETQRKEADADCTRYSSVQGPWFFGLGQLAMRNIAVGRYTDCMKGKGYVVERTG